jgi:Predicted ATP-dependent serine protease
LGGPVHQVVALKDVSTEDTRRLSTANTEFDRVLGGGLAPGSLVLIGGDPGIGKSTLVLTTLATMTAAGVKTLYVSGEESASQVKLRSERLNVSGSDMLLLCETGLEKIIEKAKEIKPQVLVVDSIQTVYKGDLPGTPGSASQLRECTLDLMVFAKNTGCITILIGHVTKTGRLLALVFWSTWSIPSCISGGPQQPVPPAAHHKEPLRCYRRDWCFRDDEPWAERRAEPEPRVSARGRSADSGERCLLYARRLARVAL